jgi:hypothetical protein
VGCLRAGDIATGWTAGTDAVASFDPIAFMNLASILVGTAILIAVSGWYRSDAGSVHLQGAF